MLSVDHLSRALEGGIARVLARVEELNRINVFPVPDGDTGSNLAHTLIGAYTRFRETCQSHPLRDVRTIMEAWADALVREARGNSGVLFAQFFTSLAQALPRKERVELPLFAQALQHAARDLYRVVSRPVEGTLLTVAREVADEAVRTDTREVRAFFERMVHRAREALARTPQLLPVLREHGVVDAGAEAFTLFVEGMKEALWGQRVALEHWIRKVQQGVIRRGGRERGDALAYRFCTEALVRPHRPVSRDAVRDRLRDLGDSLLVVATPRWIHVHIHTNHPQEVWDRLAPIGEIVETKAEDMEAQRRQDFPALLMDTTLDLPPEVAFRLGVIRVPVQVMMEGRVYRDGVDIHPEDVLRAQRAGKTLQTSQPTPQDLIDAVEKALKSSRQALCFHLSGGLSGTVRSAQQVIQSRGLAHRVRVVDTHLLSYGGGFLLWQAHDMLQAGMSVDEVLRILEQRARRSVVLLSVHDLTYLIRSGRLSGGRSLLVRALRMKVVLEFNPRDERLYPVARLLPFQRAQKRLVQEALRRMDSRTVWDVAVVHTGEMESSTTPILETIQRFRKVRRTATGAASSAVTAHIGPWGLGILAVPAS